MTFSLGLFLVAVSPGFSEKISFKLCFQTGSIGEGDLNTWINAHNLQWKEWSASQGGQLEGQFQTLTYGARYEVEMRIPIVWGVALNLGASSFSSSEEGRVSFIHGTKNQTESDFLRNEIRGIPLKIGFSYVYPLPLLENLSLIGGIGRHITFLRFKSSEDYKLAVTAFGQRFDYNLKKDGTYSSEALGVYATAGAEYELMRFLSVVVEAEKVWSKADGFKGDFSEDYLESGPQGQVRELTSGKASLFFYEGQPFWSDKYYAVLHGHKKRPEDPSDFPLGFDAIRNIRQAEFDMSTFVLRIGIRLKF